jgi:uroporphyrinogen decarboxylase
MNMHKRERLAAAVVGAPVDRPPVALWRHFPGDDQRAEDLAAAHIRWQETYDFDFLKVTPASSYAVDDYGVVTAWLGNDEGTRHIVQHPVTEPAALAELPVLDVTRGGYGVARAALARIAQAVGEDVTVLQTVFSPLAQLKKLLGPAFFPALRRQPEAVHAGLRQLTANTIAHIDSLTPIGVRGIFYAVQHASAHVLAPAEYAVFGRPYDLQILGCVPDGWLKLLHLHGQDVYFEAFVDYPIDVINWHDRETRPTLAEGQRQFAGAVAGGIRQIETLLRGAPTQVQDEALDAWQQTAGRRFILGTGCVSMITTPEANLRAARAAVETMQA